MLATQCLHPTAQPTNPSPPPPSPTTTAPVRTKLVMLSAPFLRRWSYTRAPEQISGGHRYLPPRQDINAPGGSVRSVCVCVGGGGG